MELQEWKLILLGHHGVGKSSLMLRFAKNEYTEKNPPTISAQFLIKTITINDVSINFQIWDTAGQEKFDSMAPLYYKDAHAAILVYDITDMKSYNVMQKWAKELKVKGPEHIVLAVVANKCDLIEDEIVSYAEAKAYATEIKAIYAQTSAKTNKGISEIFTKIADKLSNRRSRDSQSFRITDPVVIPNPVKVDPAPGSCSC